MRFIIGILILAVGFVSCLVVIGQVTEGETSFASRPTPSTCWSNFQNGEIYKTDFDHIDDFEIIKSGPGPTVAVNNGHLVISSATNQYALAFSRDLDIVDETLRDEFDFPIYTAGTKFDSQGADFERNFHVLNNGHIAIYASDEFGHNSLVTWHPQYWDPVEQTSYKELVQLTPGNYEHTIYVEVFSNQMSGGMLGYCDIYIDGVLTADDFPTLDNPLNFFKFGDQYIDSDAGAGRWDYLCVRGLSGAIYFENFEDGNMHDWSDFGMHEDATWRVSNGQLFVNTEFGWLNKDGWAKTQYIDYDPTENWKVSMDFYLHNFQGLGVHSTTLLYNGQFNVYINMNNLMYEDANGIPVNVMALQTQNWYFIELIRDGAATYTIKVNRDQKASNCGFSPNAVEPTISIGENDVNWMTKIYYDNVKLVVDDRLGTDSDSDLLSDGFESGMFNQQFSEKIIVWFDDFESSLDCEVLGWEDTMSRPTGDGGNGANHKWEVGRPTTTYNGAQAGDPKHGFMDTPTNGCEPERGGVLATEIDDDYMVASTMDYITTPSIDLEDVDSARLVFWQWYHFENGDDGGRVEISIAGGGFSTLGAFPAFYSHNNVVALGGVGFSGNSNGWVRAEVPIPGGAIGSSIRLRFVFATDNDNNNYPGWYIDSIRIYGKCDVNDNNVDSDFSETWVQDKLGGAGRDHHLLDGEEYFLFGSSPFFRDTDGDFLYDNLEIFHVDLKDPDIDPSSKNGRADPHTKDIYVEVDVMDTITVDNDPKDFGYPRDDFQTQDMEIHIVLDETDITHDSPITTTEALSYSDSHLRNIRKQVFFYCLVADYGPIVDGSYILGVTKGGGVTHEFAVFKGVIDNNNGWFFNTFEHELGHCMGLEHYAEWWTWENSIKPEKTSMACGIRDYRKYLDENSDTKYGFYVDSTPYEYKRFGGWQYAYTQNNFINPQFGLYFGGIWNDHL